MLFLKQTAFLVLWIACLLIAMPELACACKRHEIRIHSQAMQQSFPAMVFVPEDKDSIKNRFPVIYLLHGYGGDYRTFFRIAPLCDYADHYRVILVCPDGNGNSWYLDSDVNSTCRFATYIGSEVPMRIERDFPAIVKETARGIIGISMGGHGALTLLARYPELFHCAVSISGITDLTVFPNEWEVDKVLGTYKENKEKWRNHSFIGVADRLAGLEKVILIACGTYDFALEMNRKTHILLLDKGIKHDYEETEGGHDLRFVQKTLEARIRRCTIEMIKACGQKILDNH